MTQPPTGPPQGPPPWGHYPPPGSQPPRGRGWEIFAGVVIGGVAAVVVPILVLAAASGFGIGFAEIIVSIVLVPIVGVGLLFGTGSRPWGIGILIGWAIALIVIGGSCVAILASLGNV